MKITTVWNHRARVNQKKEGPIEVRIAYEDVTRYINTGIHCRKSEFVHGEIINRQDKNELNTILHSVEKKIVEVVSDMIEKGETLDVAEIRRRVYRVREDEVSIADWVEQQLPHMGVTAGTIQHYKTLIMRMREFGGFTSWKSINTENIYKWDSWLHGLKRKRTEAERLANQEARPITDAGVFTYHKCLKAMLFRAERFGLIERNPYSHLRGVFKRGERETVEYLTEEEMQRFIDLPTEPGTMSAMAHDLFCFQFYTGMSYVDTQAFDFSDYHEENGKWVSMRQRVKTGVDYYSVLLPAALSILAKYNMQLPHIDNADYNHELKSLAQAAHITKPVHSHVGRHSFATWALHHGVPIEILSKMLGHTNIVTTRRYAKTLAQDVRREFDKLDDVLSKNLNQNENVANPHE